MVATIASSWQVVKNRDFFQTGHAGGMERLVVKPSPAAEMLWRLQTVCNPVGRTCPIMQVLIPRAGTHPQDRQNYSNRARNAV